ncbi:MAG: bifunctional DNA primase/polymerase [Planctomycetota bacterium]|nr:bifunctional DNA primase/polymerase [Planctomycetota bacterium]
MNCTASTDRINDELKAVALLYVGEYGWPVIPCHHVISGRCSCGRNDCGSPGKHPRTAHGVKDATTEPEQIEKWWDKWPGSNIGIATGKASGLTVLDLDPRNGADLDSIKGLPETPRVSTGGGGAHLFFKCAEGRVPKMIAPGYDLKSDGGYVIGPPSNHISGGQYEWVLEPELVRLADFPDRLLIKQQAKPGKNGTVAVGNASLRSIGRAAANMANVPPAVEGNGGHDATFKAACRLVRDFALSVDQAMPLFLEWNRKCKPPWEDHELRKMLEHALEYGGGKDGTEYPIGRKVDPADSEAAQQIWLPAITWMDGVEEREWDWLWPDKIPLGALVVFHGHGDLGKSWVCIDMASRASKGVDWPGGIKNTHGPIKSLLIGAEDDPERTIIKRIHLQQGDPSKIGIMSSAKSGDDERLFSLRLDVAGLELRIVEEGIKLVFIDPITEFYGEGVNGNSNEDVRRVLSPLVQLAQRQCVAIVALTHDGKRDTDTARNKALGSVALVNTARVSFYFTADPHDHNENFALRRRLMVPDKGNIFFEKQGLAYRWRGRDQPLVWDADPITQSADAIMADTIKAARENGTPREQAKAFLRDLLGDGAMDIAEVIRLGKEEGHTEATIKAAKRDMKIKNTRHEFGGPCQWKLPGTHSVGP